MNKKLGYGALAVGSAVAIGGIGVAATIIPLSLWKTMIASDDSSAKGDVLIGEDLSLEPTLDLKNKVCFITGSNSGLGKATAKLLSSSGALVVLACKRGIPGDSEVLYYKISTHFVARRCSKRNWELCYWHH